MSASRRNTSRITGRSTRQAWLSVPLLVVLAVTVAGCSSRVSGRAGPPVGGSQGAMSNPATSEAPSHTARGLAGTTWRLVEFRSNDDKTGVLRPDDSSKYTMMLEEGSRVSMRLNCNRASGTWTATAENGTFAFGPLAGTRALCPPPSLDERIARDADFVRSYLLRDGRLYLNLMADGGTYVWEPAQRP